MEEAYQEIARKARLFGAEDPKVDQLQLVKRWLEGEDSGNWMMIIDNADDEKLFFGEDEGHAGGSSSFSSKLAQYFPQRPNGSILLTTRNKKLGVKFTAAAGVITVPKMNVAESKKLLVENLEEDDYDDNALTDLVEVLENLPLALVQAAAFIRENSQSIGEYLQMYHGSDSSRIKLLSQDFEDIERHPDSKNPVAVTWAISFEQIRKNDHRAAELLSLMSVLDRQTIPKALLSSDKEEVELEKALGTLKAFSLITPEQGRQAFNMHRLVYLATRNWMNMNEELDSWTQKALVLLSQLFPHPKFENQEIWMAYLPHARIVLNSDHLPASENIAQATLLHKVSQAHQGKGDYNSAETMAQKCLDLRKEVLGEKHVDTLYSLRNLGIVFWRQGKNKQAEKITRQALKDFEEILGKEDSSALASINGLANVLYNQGKYEEAKNLHQQALSAREKILGKEHPDTLDSVNNLALALQEQGEYEATENLHRRALSAREKILGKEHPDTLYSVKNLANVLYSQDKYEAAENLHRRALSAKEGILGQEHPDTLYSVSNLANVLYSQGKYEAAENLHRRALSAREKILGKEHPYTFKSIWSLANIFRQRFQYQDALPLYEQACAGFEKTLGSNHPWTQDCAKDYSIVVEKMKSDSETEIASISNADS